MLDLVIVGAGPAGITAAIYAARKRIDFLVVTEDIGGQAAWSADIENYTGYQFISGPELAAKFEEHLKQFDINLKENEKVLRLEKKEDKITVGTAKGIYESKTVIIASGKKSRELGVPGEREFKNKGLTYCATCDGPLYKGKDVAVVGGGNSALDAAIQLIRIAKSVVIINNRPGLSADPVMQEHIKNNPAVRVYNNAQVSAVLGDKFVNAVKIKTPQEENALPVQGVFVEIGLIPNSSFAGQIEKNELGEIIVNCRNETNVPGIFAAGDVTDVPEKQIIIAAGEGSKAALSAADYLLKNFQPL